jgi:hypothetical protein
VRKRWAVIGIVVVVLAGLVVGGRVLWNRTHRTDLQRALSMVPSSSERIGFTDWAAVRARLGIKAGQDPSEALVKKLISKAYDSDLSAASSIDDSAVALQLNYSFSPATISWEAYAQSPEGAAMVVQLPSDASMGRIADNLRSIGYKAPSTATGVWRGGIDLVASIDPTITPELQYVVLLADQHVLVSSDTSSYAALAAKVAAGDGDSSASVSSVADMAKRIDEPAAAMVWTRDFACSDLAMSQADADSQRQASQLIATAGKVSALSGLVMSMAPDRTLTVGEEFDSSGQAAENLKARARLAVGASVGRGDGSFADDFKLTVARSAGSTVLLDLKPKTKSGFVLSDLYDGPVLFATC